MRADVIATRMRVSRRAVAQIERATTPDLRTLATLAVALGCRLHIDLREPEKEK